MSVLSTPAETSIPPGSPAPDSICIPATGAVGRYPGMRRGPEVARLQLVSWEPRSAEAVR